VTSQLAWAADELLTADRNWHQLRDQAARSLARAHMPVEISHRHGLEESVFALIKHGNGVASPLPSWASVEAVRLDLHLTDEFHAHGKMKVGRTTTNPTGVHHYTV
jgi:hypothetical protein